MPVVEALVRYVKPARLDDLLEVTSRIGERKRAGFTFFCEIKNEASEIVATGYTRHVCLNPTTTKMVALPDWLQGEYRGCRCRPGRSLTSPAGLGLAVEAGHPGPPT